MEDNNSSEKRLSPVIIQSEGDFSARIILTETNYDVWSQLMEMHIAERKNSPTSVENHNHLPNQLKNTRSGMQKIRRLKDGY